MSSFEAQAIAAETAAVLGRDDVTVENGPSEVRIALGERVLKVGWDVGAPPTASAIADLARDWLHAQRSFSPESESV